MGRVFDGDGKGRRGLNTFFGRFRFFSPFIGVQRDEREGWCIVAF